MAIIYGLKVNLSVAMVAMVNQTAIKSMGHGGDDHGSSMMLNVTSTIEECEADPPKEGSTGNQVSWRHARARLTSRQSQ
jgi:ACS family sodium-dependent inorganic phosphate cotransporter